VAAELAVVDEADVDRALTAAHTAYGLDITTRATVYACTGRCPQPVSLTH
jgi:hypothetical protein